MTSRCSKGIKPTKHKKSANTHLELNVYISTVFHKPHMTTQLDLG